MPELIINIILAILSIVGLIYLYQLISDGCFGQKMLADSIPFYNLMKMKRMLNIYCGGTYQN